MILFVSACVKFPISDGDAKQIESNHGCLGLPKGWTDPSPNAVDHRDLCRLFPNLSKERLACRYSHFCALQQLGQDSGAASKLPGISLFSGKGALELGLAEPEA